VTVEIKQGHVVRTGKEGNIQSDIISVQDTRNIWKKQGWTIRKMQLPPNNGASFVSDIANNNGKMVCDGSFKFGRSSLAFLSISKENFIGTNIVPGRIEDQSAYRGELGGILGSLVTMKILCKQFGVTHGTVTIGVDCEGALTCYF